VSELLAVYGVRDAGNFLTLFITEMRGLLDDAYRGIERRDDVAVARIGHQIKIGCIYHLRRHGAAERQLEEGG